MFKRILTILAAVLVFGSIATGANLRQKQMQIVDVWGNPVTNITSLTVQDAGTSNNSTIYSDRSGINQITVPLTTASTNTTFTQNNGFFYFWSIDADYRLIVGDGTSSLTRDNLTGSDTKFFWQSEYIGSLSSFNLGDSDNLNFGTGTDVTATWNNTDTALTWSTAADGTEFRIGASGTTANFDFNVYTGTAVGLKIDEGASTFVLDGLTTSINASSNFVTNINTGSSTGAVNIGSSTSGALTMDSTSTAVLNADASVDITTSDGSGDVTLDATAGSIVIDGGEAVDDAVTITATGVGAGIDITSLGDIDITTTGTAGEDITITNTGGSLILTATEAVDDAMVLDASTAGAGMQLTSGADIDITTTGAAGEDITITNTGGSMFLTATENVADAMYLRVNGGTTETLKIHADQGTAADSIELLSDVGGIDITAETLASGDINIDANDTITITAAGLTSTSIAMNADGAAGGISFDTDDGAISIVADGATTGDIAIDSEDDMTITAGGDLTYAVTGTLSIGGAVPTYHRYWTENVVANATLVTTDSGKTFIVDGNAVDVTLTLPSVAAGDDGCFFHIVDNNEVAASDVSIIRADADTINASANAFSSDGADELPCSITIVYDHSNTDWVVFIHELGDGTAAWDSE